METFLKNMLDLHSPCVVVVSDFTNPASIVKRNIDIIIILFSLFSLMSSVLYSLICYRNS